MTSPDFWSQVRAQRDAQQPAAPVDTLLWRLVRKDQRAEAYVRVVHGVRVELRFLHNGELRRSQLCRDNDELQAISIATCAELEAKGWKDPNS
jgi:hypothetical protein